MLETPRKPHPRDSQVFLHCEGRTFKRPPLRRSQHPKENQTRKNHHSALEGQGQQWMRIDPLEVNVVDRKV